MDKSYKRGIQIGGLLVLFVVLATLANQHFKESRADLSESIVDFDLTAAPCQWEIQTGLKVDAWCYNGQVPGPELHVREGDLVRVTVHNRLPVATTVHWHGIDVPNNMDGVPGVTQEAIPPGGDFVYGFWATNPGTRMYHSHVDSNSQLELGLYGAIIVEPRRPEPIQYDREFTYILDEKALDFTPEVALGQAQIENAESGNGRGGAFQYDLFLINGKAGTDIPPLTIAKGERVRLRLINLGNLPHSMHLHGQSFTVIATDGNPVPADARWKKDTVLIGPGERYDVEIDGTNPGVWMFHCHMPNHSDNGMMTELLYDGYEPPVDHGGHDHGGGGSPNPTAPGVTALDNRFDPLSVSVPVGTTITWSNKGVNQHTATSFDGRWDTGILRPGSDGTVTFTEAGVYRYFCKFHLLAGMTGTITVLPDPADPELAGGP